MPDHLTESNEAILSVKDNIAVLRKKSALKFKWTTPYGTLLSPQTKTYEMKNVRN